MNSSVSYIMLPENGKTARSISPFEMLKNSFFFNPENHFLVQANFSHGWRFNVYGLALLEIEQLTTAFITYKLNLDLNKWLISIQQVHTQSCVFYPPLFMSALPVNWKRSQHKCFKKYLCSTWCKTVTKFQSPWDMFLVLKPFLQTSRFLCFVKITSYILISINTLTLSSSLSSFPPYIQPHSRFCRLYL